MRTKSAAKNRINVITLGCSKNVYDSEVLMGQLKAAGKEKNVLIVSVDGGCAGVADVGGRPARGRLRAAAVGLGRENQG